jgi:hypothetical protein
VDTTDNDLTDDHAQIAPAERTKAAARCLQRKHQSPPTAKDVGMWPERVRRVCGNRQHKRERPTSHAVSTGQTKKPAKKPLKTPCITFRH